MAEFEAKFPHMLESARLELLCPPPIESDEFVQQLLSDRDAATKYLPIFDKGPQGWSMEDVHARRRYHEGLYADNSGWFTVIRVKSASPESVQFAGIVGLRSVDWNNKSAEAGIIISPKYWRSGYGAEAHLTVLKQSFEVYNLHRIEFVTDAENEPMRAFYAKFGIQLEGIKRDCQLVPERATGGRRYQTMALYSILDSEWPEVKRRLEERLSSIPSA